MKEKGKVGKERDYFPCCFDIFTFKKLSTVESNNNNNNNRVSFVWMF